MSRILETNTEKDKLGGNDANDDEVTHTSDTTTSQNDEDDSSSSDGDDNKSVLRCCDAVCAICLESLFHNHKKTKVGVVTSCGHCFHASCFRTFSSHKIAAGYNYFCPACNGHVDHFRQLYLHVEEANDQDDDEVDETPPKKAKIFDEIWETSDIIHRLVGVVNLSYNMDAVVLALNELMDMLEADPSVINLMAHSGAIQATLKLLTDRPCNEHACSVSFRFLISLCINSGKNNDIIRAILLRAFPLLHSTILTHRNSPTVQHCGLYLLWRLAFENCPTRLEDMATVVQTVVDSLETHSTDSRIHDIAFCLLGCILDADQEENDTEKSSWALDMVKAGACRVALEVARNDLQDLTLQEKVAKYLRKLSMCNDRFVPDLIDEGVLPWISKVTKMHPASSCIQHQCSVVLGKVYRVAGVDMWIDLCEQGAVEHFVKVMKNHKSDADIVEDVLWALHVAVQDKIDDTDREEAWNGFITKDLIETLLSCLNNQKEETSILSSGCNILASIIPMKSKCSEKNDKKKDNEPCWSVMTFAKARGVETILSLGRDHADDVHLQHAISALLMTLASHDWLVPDVFRGGVVEWIVSVMSEHRDNSSIQSNCCGMLQYLLYVGGADTWADLCIAGAVKGVTAAARAHLGDEVTSENAFSALSYFACNYIDYVYGRESCEATEYLWAEDLVEICLSGMKSHPDNKHIQQDASATLANLLCIDCDEDQFSEENRQIPCTLQLVSSGGIDTILSAIENHPDYASVLDCALCALANLSDLGTLSRRVEFVLELLVEKGIIAKTFASMRKFVHDEHVQGVCCWVFQSYFKHGPDEISTDLLVQGAVELIMAAIRLHKGVTATMVAASLALAYAHLRTPQSEAHRSEAIRALHVALARDEDVDDQLLRYAEKALEYL